MISIRETMSQLIELSKQDKWEQTQRTSFDILITKTRELVDDMLEEQRNEDVQFRNVTNLLMKYSVRQEHALEIVKDKHQLMKFFVEFVNSIEITGGKIDIKTDYSQLTSILKMLKNQLMEYQEVEKVFTNKFALVYDNLKKFSFIFQDALKKTDIPYLTDAMKEVDSRLDGMKMSTQVAVKDKYLYNINPKLEIEMITNYIEYFEKKAKKETDTITPNFFPSFEKETKEAKNEIVSLGFLLDQAEAAMKVTTDSLKSNYEEYHANMKSRRDVTEVIYQILDLMNKRARKIKGYQLKYIEEIRQKFNGFEESFEFVAYKKYIFKEPPAEEIMSREMPKLPDLHGIEDDNAKAPGIRDHVKLNVNNATVATNSTVNI
jgi:hypothetical protein